MTINSGIIPGAKKVVLYGAEGIGKSTFASKFPEPVFIDTEGSTKSMDVRRFDPPKKWSDIAEAIKYVIANPDCCRTLVIDTADWAEMICIKYTCEKGGVNGIEDFGYGKGYVYVQENFKKMLDMLESVINAGINVVITAHAKMRKFEQPDEMGAYDRWEMKLTKQVAPMLKEWADMVLFANYKTYVVEDDKTKSKKAQGGKRVMYTTHNPCWDAKNRAGLDDCVAFDYESIRAVIEGENKKAVTSKPQKKNEKPKSEPKPEPKEEPKQETKPETKPAESEPKPEEPEVIQTLRRLMKNDGISAERLEYAVAMKGAYFSGTPFTDYDPEFIQNSLISKWNAFVKYAKKFKDSDIKMETIPFD